MNPLYKLLCFIRQAILTLFAVLTIVATFTVIYLVAIIRNATPEQLNSATPLQFQQLITDSLDSALITAIVLLLAFVITSALARRIQKKQPQPLTVK